jgi:hypothetical protein
VPECDARHPHAGIPEDNCITPTNACAWPDAWGAVTEEPDAVSALVSGEGEVTFRWHTSDLGDIGPEGPVRRFVVRVWARKWNEVRRIFVPVSDRSVVIANLRPGDYMVEVQSQNDSGLSPGATDMVTVPDPTPSPTPKPTPTATTSMQPTPSESPGVSARA